MRRLRWLVAGVAIAAACGQMILYEHLLWFIKGTLLAWLPSPASFNHLIWPLIDLDNWAFVSWTVGIATIVWALAWALYPTHPGQNPAAETVVRTGGPGE